MNSTSIKKLDYLDHLIARDSTYKEMLLRCGVLEK